MKVLVFEGNEFNEAMVFGPCFSIDELDWGWLLHFTEGDTGAGVSRTICTPSHIEDYVPPPVEPIVADPEEPAEES